MRSLLVAVTIAIAGLFEPISPAGAQPSDANIQIQSPSSETKIPRKILALYDETDEPSADSTRIHRWLETPLNHLGYVLTYSKVGKELPTIQDDHNYAAVATWFSHPLTTNDGPYANWAISVALAGKKTIILGSIGVGYWSPAFRTFERVLSLMGLRHSRQYVDLTHGTTTIRRNFSQQGSDPVVPPYPVVEAADTNLDILLELRTPARYGAKPSIVVATSHGGGYAAAGFEIHHEPLIDRTKWVLDPLSFLDAALGHPTWPRPDITTLGGRRIWINQVCADVPDFPIEEGKPRSLPSVLQHELNVEASDAPVTLFLTPEVVVKAREDQFFKRELSDLLRRPNIETALTLEQSKALPISEILSLFQKEFSDIPLKIMQLPQGSRTEQYKLENRAQFILSVGEGYSHAKYPTFADISPLSTDNDRENRVNIGPLGGCSPSFPPPSGSDEIRAIRSYLATTDATPRSRAANIALHVSGLREPETIRDTFHLLEEARAGLSFPFQTSAYVSLLADFQTFTVVKREKDAWRITSRGGIQTVRFDHSGIEADLNRSSGVLGQYVEDDSLYLSLDADIKEPLIVLKERKGQDDTIGLKQTSWQISRLTRRNCGMSHVASGFGPGDFEWYGMKPGNYKIIASQNGKRVWSRNTQSDQSGRLNFRMPAIGHDVISIDIGCEDADAK